MKKNKESNAFQAIADPSRRQILKILQREHLTINELARNFQISRPAVSKHIKVLHENGFISIESNGRERFCVLKKEGFDDLQNWIHEFDDFWNTKIKSLETLMNKKHRK